MKNAQLSAVTKFRALHESGCFVLPNPWDVGTAIYLRHLGFKALATTSAGFAFSRGKPDGGVSLGEMLRHIVEIAAATTLPVNADFLNGFADEPEAVARNLQLFMAHCVAGRESARPCAQLADLGVSPTTGGSGVDLAAWGACRRAAQVIQKDGSFNLLVQNAPSADLNEQLRGDKEL